LTGGGGIFSLASQNRPLNPVNYRHHFHAGNVADVFKHLILVQVLEALRRKETPFCVIDSHAGSGLYRLAPPGEFEQGIGRLWPVRADWAPLAEYFALLAPYNRTGLSAYPGSPLIIRDRLRPQDRAVFIERHPEEAAALRDNLRCAGTHECRERRTRRSGLGSRGITINEADAWAALKGLLPPKENRGLVFIDPPYEKPDELDQVAQALRTAYPRWRNGLYLVWYPIKARRPVEKLHAAVRALGAEALAVEFLTLPEDMPQRLNGSGVILINPPWKLDEALRTLLPPLATFLAGPDGQPQVRFVNLSAGKNPQVS
jgi:23S rRNA (adenine2030-N6)-methyltransferase